MLDTPLWVVSKRKPKGHQLVYGDPILRNAEKEIATSLMKKGI